MANPQVLLVEDDEALADTICKALSEEGFDVEVAYDGEAGLFRMSDGRHAVVILDVMLPGLDGLALLENARARRVNAPVLFLTARGMVDDRVRGLNAGGDDYLLKPFALAELIARVHALARRSQS